VFGVRSLNSAVGPKRVLTALVKVKYSSCFLSAWLVLQRKSRQWLTNPTTHASLAPWDHHVIPLLFFSPNVDLVQILPIVTVITIAIFAWTGCQIDLHALEEVAVYN
jgi:hypothetical protein